MHLLKHSENWKGNQKPYNLVLDPIQLLNTTYSLMHEHLSLPHIDAFNYVCSKYMLKYYYVPDIMLNSEDIIEEVHVPQTCILIHSREQLYLIIHPPLFYFCLLSVFLVCRKILHYS